MKNLLFPLMLAAALMTGVAIGYFGKPDAPTSTMERQRHEAQAIADVGKQREIYKVSKTVTVTNMVTVTNGMARFGFGGRGGNPREWMEELKKNDPERFVQMTNRFAQWRARRQERTAKQLDFLSSIDTSRMSAGAKKTHDALQELLLRQEELDQQLHQEGLSDERRGQLMQEMRELHHEIRKANGEERQNLLGEMAANLGFEGDDAQEIVNTVKDIVDATEGGRGGGPGGPPPPGGGAGGAPGMPAPR